MPKTEIDYSNTIIYKITCKDAGIKDVYVGHTTNFVQRKRAHKQSCVNPKSTNHACKLYAIMREHGGWTNWRMEIVHFFTCNNQCEARIKEQEYFVLLNATLNSIEPMPAVKPVPKHKEPVKILPSVIETPKVNHSSSKFWCEKCDFACCKNSNFLKHLTTVKHNKRVLSATINNLIPEKAAKFVCNTCNKSYKERSGLWRHSKTCKPTPDASNNFVVDKELVILLMKENSELKKIIHTQNNIIDNTQNHMMDVLKSAPYNSTQPI
jgi:hypothetical protein